MKKHREHRQASLISADVLPTATLPTAGLPAAALLTAAVLIAGCAAGGAGNRYNPHAWPAGTTATYVLTTGQTQTAELPGMGEQALNSSTTIDLTIASAGPQTFTLTVNDASDTDDAAALGGPTPDISMLVGFTSSLTVSERGEITEATGLEANKYVIDQGGVASFEDILQTLFLYLPEGKLAPGAQWTREYGFSLTQMDGTVLDFAVVEHYTCIEKTDFEGVPAWKIEAVSETAVTGTGDAGGGVLMELGLSGSGTALLYVAPGTAMLLAAEWDATLHGGVSVAGMNIPVTMHWTRGAILKER